MMIRPFETREIRNFSVWFAIIGAFINMAAGSIFERTISDYATRVVILNAI